MKHTLLFCFESFLTLIILNCFDVALGVENTEGGLTLPESSYSKKPLDFGLPNKTELVGTLYSSRKIVIKPPMGWKYATNGANSRFIVTREGRYLQNILIERIHVEDSKGILCWDCAFPYVYVSWPMLQKRFTPHMAPMDAATVVIENLRQNSALSNFSPASVELQTIDGHECFKAMFEYRIAIKGRQVPYRTVYYGLVLGDWFYSISYSGAARYYYEKDIENFYELVKSLRFGE